MLNPDSLLLLLLFILICLYLCLHLSNYGIHCYLIHGDCPKHIIFTEILALFFHSCFIHVLTMLLSSYVIINIDLEANGCILAYI